ncbi:hypothetical protein EBZ39_00190 [bacterium]|nr:hypothetical protein [bacterium]
MSIRNQNWYNLQTTRRYPLDENSTGLDDSGVFIRDDILVDCNIRFPNTYGEYVYVQGITVSAGLATVVFGVSQTRETSAGAILAAITVPQPVSPYVNYSITGLHPGVSGWVVFGPGVEIPFTGRYSTVRQTLVSPRCARGYKPLPIPTIGKFGLNDVLQGVVSLVGEFPVKVRYMENAGDVVKKTTAETTPYADNVRALVIELDTSEITTDYNPLQLFLGPCGQRPESGTCPKPPIENINGIAPDCNGNVEIVFENFNDVRPFTDCGGTDIISNNDLGTICAGVNVQSKRPKQYTDDCCVAGFDVPTEADLATFPVEQRTSKMIVRTVDTNERWQLADDLITWTVTNSAEYCTWPDPTTLIPDIIIDELPPTPVYPPVALPACVDFANCQGSDAFQVQTGKFDIANVLSPPGCSSCVSAEIDIETINATGNDLTTKPTYIAISSSTLNIATFKNSATDWTLNKTITAEIRIGTGGLERNGGIVLNYQKTLNAAQQRQTTFVVAVLDAARGQVRVLRYTNNFVTLESAATMTIKTGSWYRLYVTPVSDGNSIALNVYAEEMTTTNPATVNMTVQIDAASYGDLIGAAGLFTSRSYTYFNKFTIVEQA